MSKLKIGSTIKTAFNIYRHNFKEYYRLALTNSLWIFIPVYGWAKYAAMMGLLARLSYGEAADNPETIAKAKRYIKPKTWLFFGAGLIETIIFYFRLSFVFIPLRIALLVVVGTSSFSLLFDSPFWLAVAVISFCYYYWVMSQLFLYELPIAIEGDANAGQARNIAGQLVRHSYLSLPIIIFSFSCLYVCLSLIKQVVEERSLSRV